MKPSERIQEIWNTLPMGAPQSEAIVAYLDEQHEKPIVAEGYGTFTVDLGEKKDI